MWALRTACTRGPDVQNGYFHFCDLIALYNLSNETNAKSLSNGLAKYLHDGHHNTGQLSQFLAKRVCVFKGAPLRKTVCAGPLNLQQGKGHSKDNPPWLHRGISKPEAAYMVYSGAVLYYAGVKRGPYATSRGQTIFFWCVYFGRG